MSAWAGGCRAGGGRCCGQERSASPAGQSQAAGEAAEAWFEQDVAEQREQLLKGFQLKIDEAIKRGDLKTIETLEAESKAFEESGELPGSEDMADRVEPYYERIGRAGDKLVEIYNWAMRQYTQDRDLETAKAIQAKI